MSEQGKTIEDGNPIQLEVGSKGRLIIPKSIFPPASMAKGSRLEIQVVDGAIILIPVPKRKDRASAALQLKFSPPLTRPERTMSAEDFSRKLGRLSPRQTASAPKKSTGTQFARKDAPLAVAE